VLIGGSVRSFGENHFCREKLIGRFVKPRRIIIALIARREIAAPNVRSSMLAFGAQAQNMPAMLRTRPSWGHED
jgi:hypothetical protein